MNLKRLSAFALTSLLSAALFVLVTPNSLASCTALGIEGGSPVRVFLVAGQSNAVGSDTHAAEIDNYPPYVGAGAPQTGATIWYEIGGAGGYGSGGWIPMQPTTQTQIFGPELTFASMVGDETASEIAIIKSAKGGTTLAVDWDPGNPNGAQMYARTLALVQTALTNLTNSGVDWVWEGVVWQQGENDMLNSAQVAQYDTRLSALIDRFRTDLGQPTLKWFIGGTSFKCIWGLDFSNNMRTLRGHQLSVTNADPLAYFVPSSHLEFAILSSGQPHYHFGTGGMLQLGEAHAKSYLTSIGFDLSHQSEPFENGLPAEQGDTVRVFVLAGQRSMEGEGAYVSEIQNHASFAGLDQLQQNVLYSYYLGGGEHISTAWAPLGPTDFLENFGPELSFGQAVKRASSDPVAVIKIADSAGFLVDWTPGHPSSSRPLYDNALRFIRRELSNLRTLGMNPVLEGVVWLPAEHDAWWTPYRQQYAANLSALVTRMRADLGAPGLKWFVAELRDNMTWGQNNLDLLDAQIETVAAADPLLWFIPTDSLPPSSPAPTLRTEGALHLGRLMARAYAWTLP
ncbi:MAG: hypothetical protein ACI835_003092 [Planctomycetota bacterium]|jgi:hypothetical protein